MTGRIPGPHGASAFHSDIDDGTSCAVEQHPLCESLAIHVAMRAVCGLLIGDQIL